MQALVAAANAAARQFNEHVHQVDGNVGRLVQWFEQQRQSSFGSRCDGPLGAKWGCHRSEDDQEAKPGELSKGELVSVWSRSGQRWVENGVVNEVLARDFVLQETPGRRPEIVPAGSVQVVFGHGRMKQVKWVLPWQRLSMLKRLAPRGAAGAAHGAVVPGGAAGAAAVDARSAWLTGVTPAARALQQGHEGRGRLRTGTGIEDEAQQMLQDTERGCRANACRFVDRDFQQPAQVMFTFGRKHQIHAWLSPQEITFHDGQPLTSDPFTGLTNADFEKADWRLFRGPPRAVDVQQGELGDCWFLSSLACLADFQEGRIVRALLPRQTGLSPFGAYVVRLCIGGRWRAVLVDERLPCIGGGLYYKQLGFCVTHHRQLWASIIEKAFAKACGSYEALSAGGDAMEALSVLTGWPCTMIRLNRKGFEPNMFWASLLSSKDAGFLTTCSTRESKSLEPYHVFSLMDAVEVRTPKACARLVKIRDQQEKSQRWNGAWGDSAGAWTAQLRRQLDYPEGGRPGVFFMTLDEFLQEFAHCTICRIRSSEWHEDRKEAVLPENDAPCIGLTLKASEKTECMLSLVQPEERCRSKGGIVKGLSEKECCIGWVLIKDGSLKASAGFCGKAEAEATAGFRVCNAVSEDCWLQPGCNYVLLPLSLQSGPPIPATLTCVSSHPVTFGECRFDKDRDAVKRAWAAYARANCDNPGHFQGGSMFLGKADGGACVVVAENRGDGHFCVEFSLKSTGLRYSRGRPVTSDWLRPGYGQILQVAQPLAESDGSAGWHQDHKFHVAFQVPKVPAHVPPVGPDGAWDLHSPFRL